MIPKTNPENEMYIGLGPQKLDENGMRQRYVTPSAGMLRFVVRGEQRILQRYEWSSEDGRHDWYDVPLVRDPVSVEMESDDETT